MPTRVEGDAGLFKLGRDWREEAFVGAGDFDAGILESDAERARSYAANAII